MPRKHLVVILTLSVAAGLVSLAAEGLVFREVAASQSPQAGTARYCTLPDGLIYSVGALVKYQDGAFRCTNVWGQGFTPAGVVWVEVESKDGGFVVK
jgi:hypothetical protein